MVQGGGDRRQVLARVATLAAELVTIVGELSTPGGQLPPPPPPPGLEHREKFSTREAADRLGVSSYTLREWVRRGWIQARQDASGGPYHFDAAELARYEREHQTDRVAERIAEPYTPGHDNAHGTARHSAQVESDTSAARGRAARDGKHDRAVGARRARRRPAGGASPNAPSAAAWAGWPPWPESDEPDPEAES